MGAGTLGKLVLQPPVDINEGTRRFNVLQDAQATVARMGYPTPGLPTSGYKGEMPSDITSQDDDDLGGLLQELGEYIGSLESALAQAEVDRNAAEAHVIYIKARVRLGFKAASDIYGKLTDKDKNDLVETEPRVIDAISRALYCEAVYKITKALLSKSDRDWNSVSRRITQRGQDVQRMVRGSNVAGVPVGAPTFRRRHV